jgi:tetratricopeptide (TPR) repeat protein/cbb3-type cytochrome oxidase subunit 3
VLSRSELRERLWPADTFVDFEDGLNTAMRKLREALRDDPQSPRYIETVRGRGYRLVASVEVVSKPAAETGTEQNSPPAGGSPASPSSISGNGLTTGNRSGDDSEVAVVPSQQVPAVRRFLSSWWTILLIGIAVIGVLWVWLNYRKNVIASDATGQVLVADFDNQTGDPRFGGGLLLALSTDIGQSRQISVYPRLLLNPVLQRMERAPDDAITPAIGLEICRREAVPVLILPSIFRAGKRFRITVQLVEAEDGKTIVTDQRNVDGEDEILPALDSLTGDLRRALGESLLQIHLGHQPLAQVTTSSLAALEAYSEGMAHWNADRQTEGIALYQKAIEDDPNFAMAHAALASADYSYIVNDPVNGEKEFKKALSLADRVSDRERDLIAIHYAQSQSRFNDALDLFRTYLGRYPDDLSTQYNYAHTLRLSGDSQGAFDVYARLLKQMRDFPPLYIELATTARALRRGPEAIDFYRKAFALDSRIHLSGNISREYGTALIENHQFAQAEEEFKSDLAFPDARERGEVSLAMLDMYQGEYDAARPYLESALKLTADSPLSAARVHYLLAEIEQGKGRKREAVAQLNAINSSLSQIKQNVVYGALLGQAYIRDGELRKAKDVLAFIVPLANSKDEEQVFYLQLLRAEMRAADGEPVGAIQMLPVTAPAASDADRILTEEALAHFCQMAGRTQEAVQWYERFVNEPGSLMWEPQQRVVSAYFLLANDYQQLGDRANAAKNAHLLFSLWSHADADLRLRRDALALQHQLN